MGRRLFLIGIHRYLRNAISDWEVGRSSQVAIPAFASLGMTRICKRILDSLGPKSWHICHGFDLYETVSAKGAAFISSLGQRPRNSGRAKPPALKVRFILEHRYPGFFWQRGYGAFSVSPSQLDAVLQYLQTQEEHHRTRTFQEEYRELLRRHGIEFDEQFVWD